jgi:nucleotide-binding universal stress UspA family protein
MNPRTDHLSAGPILVPVDFSKHSEAALRWAEECAHSFGAALYVLHVVHDPESAPGYYTRTDDGGHLQRLEEGAREMLVEFLKRVPCDHPGIRGAEQFQTELVAGLPASRILEVAERIGARMIVMGSQGRTGLSHLLLGSKAERVVQLSPIPVTIVKAKPAVGEDG